MIVLTMSDKKFVYVWLEIFSSYQVEKKGRKGKFFETKAIGQDQEMIKPRLSNVPEVLFFLLR